MEYKNENEILECSHKWKESRLLFSTVFDCSKCGVRKEDWENSLSKKVKSNSAHKNEIYKKWDDFDWYNTENSSTQILIGGIKITNENTINFDSECDELCNSSAQD